VTAMSTAIRPDRHYIDRVVGHADDLLFAGQTEPDKPLRLSCNAI
jgi:hypothetical protein